MKNSVIIILFLFFVLVCFFTCKCYHLLNKKNDYVVKIEQKVDTVIIYDTVTRYIPKYIVKKTIDTIYLQSIEKDGVVIPIEQRYYREEGMYDAWVSGYLPSLDSIKTYPRVEYRTITNNVTKEILVKKWNFYTCIGLKRFSNEYVPSVGFIAKSPRNSLYGVEVGAINGDLYYGLTYGFILK